MSLQRAHRPTTMQRQADQAPQEVDHNAIDAPSVQAGAVQGASPQPSILDIATNATEQDAPSGVAWWENQQGQGAEEGEVDLGRPVPGFAVGGGTPGAPSEVGTPNGPGLLDAVGQGRYSADPVLGQQVTPGDKTPKRTCPPPFKPGKCSPEQAVTKRPAKPSKTAKKTPTLTKAEKLQIQIDAQKAYAHISNSWNDRIGGVQSLYNALSADKGPTDGGSPDILAKVVRLAVNSVTSHFFVKLGKMGLDEVYKSVIKGAVTLGASEVKALVANQAPNNGTARASIYCNAQMEGLRKKRTAWTDKTSSAEMTHAFSNMHDGVKRARAFKNGAKSLVSSASKRQYVHSLGGWGKASAQYKNPVTGAPLDMKKYTDVHPTSQLHVTMGGKQKNLHVRSVSAAGGKAVEGDLKSNPLRVGPFISGGPLPILVTHKDVKAFKFENKQNSYNVTPHDTSSDFFRNAVEMGFLDRIAANHGIKNQKDKLFYAEIVGKVFMTTIGRRRFNKLPFK